MKKITSIIMLIAFVFLLSSCGEQTQQTASSEQKSVSSQSSFEKPAAINKKDNKPSVFEGETLQFDVTPEDIIKNQTSLDTYSAKAQWIADNQLLVVYSYPVEKMPNYYVTQARVRIYDTSNDKGSYKELDLPDEFPLVKAFNGGFAVVSKSAATAYNTKLEKIWSHAISSDATWFDVNSNGTTVIYADGESSSSLMSVTSAGQVTKLADGGKMTYGALNSEGSTACYICDGKPNIVSLSDQKITAISTDDVTLSSALEAYWLGKDVLVVDKPQGGEKVASILYSTENGNITKPSVGGEFENPYAQGKFFEASGKLYLAYGLCNSNFALGDLELQSFNEDLEVANSLSLAGGYYRYNSYDYSPSGRLAICENLAETTDIKSYVHLF